MRITDPIPHRAIVLSGPGEELLLWQGAARDAAHASRLALWALRTCLRAFAIATGGLAPELPEIGAQARSQAEGGRPDERWTLSFAATRLVEPGHGAPRRITIAEASAMLAPHALLDALTMEVAQTRTVAQAAYAVACKDAGLRWPRFESTVEAEPIGLGPRPALRAGPSAAHAGLALAALLTASGHPPVPRAPRIWAATPAETSRLCHAMSRVPASASARSATAAATTFGDGVLAEVLAGGQAGRRW